MRKVKMFIVQVFTILSCSLLLSCNNSTPNNTVELAKIDSLTNLANNQQEHIGEMEEFITSLSLTIDSIDVMENEIIGEGDIEKRTPITKESILNSLTKFKETISRQKESIANLEKLLKKKDDEMSTKMLQIVTFYKKQLDEKDATIASLQKNLSESKRNIIDLKRSVSNLMSANKTQKEVIKEQEAVMSRQTSMINTCYVKIATKKELKAEGLLTGGFLKKNKLNEEQLSSANFTVRDMRSCIDILIKSSKPKVLTQMPASSYSIVKNDNGTCYLHIIDPNAFWSISRYLVIQL